MQIVAEPFFETGVSAPTVDLSVAGEAGSHGVADLIVGMFFAKLVREFRALGTRADETHLAAKNIPELRKLVEAESPQIRSDWGASWVVRHGPDRAKVALGVLLHGSELNDGEPAPSEANASLPVEDGAAVRETNSSGDQYKQRRKEYEREYGNDDIDRPFGQARQARNGLMRAEARCRELPISFRSALRRISESWSGRLHESMSPLDVEFARQATS